LPAESYTVAVPGRDGPRPRCELREHPHFGRDGMTGLG
jgi:hypothetical protein